MKSIVMPVSEQLSEEIKNRLSEEVKETVAGEATVTNRKKTFTASEMWNRQKQMRSASDRIRRWNLN
jgi:hypothetical protein